MAKANESNAGLEKDGPRERMDLTSVGYWSTEKDENGTERDNGIKVSP